MEETWILIKSQFSLGSIFTRQMSQIWILIIIFTLFVIRHYKNIILFGIHGFNALDWQESLFVPLFFIETKFISQMGETWILIITSIFFMIVH